MERAMTLNESSENLGAASDGPAGLPPRVSNRSRKSTSLAVEAVLLILSINFPLLSCAKLLPPGWDLEESCNCCGVVRVDRYEIYGCVDERLRRGGLDPLVACGENARRCNRLVDGGTYQEGPLR